MPAAITSVLSVFNMSLLSYIFGGFVSCVLALLSHIYFWRLCVVCFGFVVSYLHLAALCRVFWLCCLRFIFGGFVLCVLALLSQIYFWRLCVLCFGFVVSNLCLTVLGR